LGVLERYLARLRRQGLGTFATELRRVGPPPPAERISRQGAIPTPSAHDGDPASGRPRSD
jgi:hypothetical protein